MNIETFNIKDFIDNYKSDNSTEREGRRKDTNEVFTPFEIVENMCSKIPDEDWADGSKTFLEPSFGIGNIILYIIWRRLKAGVSWYMALDNLYGTELMPDNVKECKARILELLHRLEVDCFDSDVLAVLDKNLVCTDFFEWDFDRWKPIEKEEKQESNAVALF